MFYRDELFPKFFFLRVVGVCFVPCAPAAKICCDDDFCALSLPVSGLSMILSVEFGRVYKSRDESLLNGRHINTGSRRC